ncbi:MAG: hypothetical protein K1060chlam2_00369 [Chlamydiae bacterium]|nr:hypothetical protein [Chlamydiota bacterium]
MKELPLNRDPLAGEREFHTMSLNEVAWHQVLFRLNSNFYTPQEIGALYYALESHSLTDKFEFGSAGLRVDLLNYLGGRNNHPYPANKMVKEYFNSHPLEYIWLRDIGGVDFEKMRSEWLMDSCLSVELSRGYIKLQWTLSNFDHLKPKQLEDYNKREVEVILKKIEEDVSKWKEVGPMMQIEYNTAAHKHKLKTFPITFTEARIRWLEELKELTPLVKLYHWFRDTSYDEGSEEYMRIDGPLRERLGKLFAKVNGGERVEVLDPRWVAKDRARKERRR